MPSAKSYEEKREGDKSQRCRRGGGDNKTKKTKQRRKYRGNETKTTTQRQQDKDNNA